MNQEQRLRAAKALQDWGKENDIQMPLYDAISAISYILSELED